MTSTLTQSGTQSGTPTNTHTPFQVAVAPTDTPNVTYIAIGSVMGSLVLMTIVVVVILLNNRPKKPLHYVPTMMTVNPLNPLKI
jgi:hypothetical protein